MNEKQREQIALFRYGLIVPLINNQVENMKEYIAKVTHQAHEVPYYGTREFTPKTIQNWLNTYKRRGFDGLKPKPRSDKGDTRAIRGELKEKILDARKRDLDITVQLFYEKMIKQGVFLPNEVSYSTLNRYLKRHNLAAKRISAEPERKRFAFDKVNMLWQGDLSYGPYLKTPKKKMPTYLIAFIDDCSRIIPYAMFSYQQSFDPLKHVFKEGLLRRGIPRLVYVDNGKIYRSDMFNVICASLGINLVHTKPFDAASKGKIERFFGTVRKRFYPLLKDKPCSTIDELNRRFWIWLEEDYHRKEHSALGMSPLDKYLSQSSSVTTIDNPKEIEEVFWFREMRKVSSVSTVSLNKIVFEVPPQFIGQRVELRYDSQKLENVYVFHDGKKVVRAKKVVYADNARAKRTATISFASLSQDGKDQC